MHSVSELTQGTDTSQYLEEEKSTETPLVAASESGPSPNQALRLGLRGLEQLQRCDQRNGLERPTIEGDSPVCDDRYPALRGFPE